MGFGKRNTAEGIALALIPTGATLCVVDSPAVIALGALSLLVALILISSLFWGWPIKALQLDIPEPSMDGVPLNAPMDYQLDQIRQILPQMGDDMFDLWALRGLFPKCVRVRRVALYEPIEASTLKDAFARLVETGEVELVKPGVWKATGKKSPRKHLRWRHG